MATRCPVMTPRVAEPRLCLARPEHGFASGRDTNLRGENNEYLDNLIRGAADRLARRIDCVPRCGWADSPAAGIRGDLADSSLATWQQGRMSRRQSRCAPNRNCNESLADFSSVVTERTVL